MSEAISTVCLKLSIDDTELRDFVGPMFVVARTAYPLDMDRATKVRGAIKAQLKEQGSNAIVLVTDSSVEISIH